MLHKYLITVIDAELICLPLPNNRFLYNRLIPGYGMGVADCEVHSPIEKGSHQLINYYMTLIWVHCPM